MSEEIKELENTPEKAVYQFGEGKDALTLSVYEDKYNQDVGDYNPVYHHETIVKLTSQGISLFHISQDSHGVETEGYTNLEPLAEKLYDNNSKEARAVKMMLSQIKGNSLIDRLNSSLKNTPTRREEEKQRQIQNEEEMRHKAEQQRLEEAQNKKNAENALNNFIGADDAQTTKEAVATNDVATNKLAILRKKITHDIDETFGTNLEEKKLPNVVKRRFEEPMSKIFEKIVSNKKIKE